MPVLKCCTVSKTHTKVRLYKGGHKRDIADHFSLMGIAVTGKQINLDTMV